MDTKKDIGQFFNDHLNQMDFTPNENGWNKIEIELKEKKKKRKAFFWLFFGAFLSGSFLTLLAVYSNNLWNTKSEIDTNKTNIESSVSTKDQNTSNRPLHTFSTDNNSETEQVNHNNNATNAKSNRTLNKDNSNHAVANQNTNLNKSSITNKLRTNKSNHQKDHSKNYKNSNYTFTKSKRKSKFNTLQKTKGVASSYHSKQKNKGNKKHILNANMFNNINMNNGNEVAEMTNDIKQDSSHVNHELLAKDTTIIAEITKKSAKKTEKLIEKDSTKVEKESKSNTFIFSPYYGYGFTHKNQVKGNFKSDANQNITNEQYGFVLRWMANKRYGVQIGLGYINASTKTEIEKTNSNNLAFNSIENNLNISFPASNKLMMYHDLTMYEIPLEFYYKAINKKIGLSFASGISHTIIKNNEVFIETTQEKIKVGSLGLLDDNSFSANFKIYGNYNITKKLQFELFPSFQYQFINSMKSKDLNPFIISVRAGVSYQFK